MWKNEFIKLAYKLNSVIASLGLGNLKAVQSIKSSMKKLMAPNDLILIEIQGHNMYIYFNTIDMGVYLFSPFEPFTTELFKQAIKPGSKVIDIGAQFGYYSLIAARQAGLDGLIYAFEPAPANFKLLIRNIQMNGYCNNIKAIQKGVGNRNKNEKLFIYEGCDSHGMHRHDQRSLKETISIECIAIDNFLGESPVDVIKMDIEGNEPFALEGMKQTILRSQNIILFVEINPSLLNQAGVETEDYLDQLEGLGLNVQLIDEQSHCLKPLSREFLKKVDPDWYANLYCSKKM